MVITVYLLLLVTCLFSAAIIGLFGYLLLRKKKLNTLAEKKAAYYERIYPHASRYIARGSELSKQKLAPKAPYEKQVMKTILLQAAGAVTSGAARERLIELVREAGIIDETAALIASKKWWMAANGITVAGKLGLNEFAPAIREHMRSGEWHLLYEAAKALCQMGKATEVVDYMIEADEHLPAKAIGHLGDIITRSIDAEKDLDMIVQRFNAAPLRQQALFIEMIGRKKAARYVPFITRFTQDGESELFLPALKAIAGIGICLAEEPVLRALCAEDWETKVVAVLVVHKCRLRRAVPLLEELLQDASWWVRLRAAEALDQFGPGAQSRLVWASEHHKDPYARDIAAKVLQEKTIKGILL